MFQSCFSLDLGPMRLYCLVMADEVELALITMVFNASDPDRLLSVLSKYVVLARGSDGCRNIDLANSFSDANRFMIIEKWDTEQLAHKHFDSIVMVEMAKACSGLLSHAPKIELLQGLSVHDLA